MIYPAISSKLRKGELRRFIMDTPYQATLQNMEATLFALSLRIPQPKWVPMGDGFVFRYVEKSIHQAIVQKLARIISTLYAARILLEHGFTQEQAALQRMLDEFQDDVIFLSHGVISNDITDMHREYLDAFCEEEFAKPNDAVGSTQKRKMISRQKIRAYISRIEGSGLDTSRMVNVLRTLSKTYSGYVHGASPHIMEMYGGQPARFQVAGWRESPLYPDHQWDLWNYFYRGICAFGFASKAFGDDELFKRIQAFRDDFAMKAGKTAEVSTLAETKKRG